jgi:5-methylcytosine-specific restriction endonuclease McrA
VSAEYHDCACGRGSYSGDYTSCYECYLDRRADYLDCIFCGRWHSPKFATCFQCRRTHPGRDEAATQLRAMIHIRDGFTCRYCGDDLGPFQVDHIKPCAHGGKADPWNLQTLCSQCNRDKGADFTDRDDRQLGEYMEAYFTYLYDFLTENEKARLHTEMKQRMSGSLVLTGPIEQLHLRAVHGDHGAALDFRNIVTDKLGLDSRFQPRIPQYSHWWIG